MKLGLLRGGRSIGYRFLGIGWPKMGERIGDLIKLRNEEIHDIYS